jgi:hypothetical protein
VHLFIVHPTRAYEPITHGMQWISCYSQSLAIVCDQNAAVLAANAAEGWIR